MTEAYETAKSMVFYKIDSANRRRANSINYAISLDVVPSMVRQVSGQLSNHLRKLGYKVRMVRGTMLVSWT